MRNMLLTCLLRYPAASVPFKFRQDLSSVGPHPSVRESTRIFRLRLLGSIMAKMPQLILKRKPVSVDTVEAYAELLNSSRSGK